jgi:hypothetical protein
MTHTFDFELTVENIRVLASLIYEPVPRVWIRGRWRCPFCLALNAKAHGHCACGVSRDAEVVEASMAGNAREDFTEMVALSAWLPDAAARQIYSA